MKRGEFVIKLADKLVKQLMPYCSRIQIAGSIRRKEKNPQDIDIVLIPKNKKNKIKIEELLNNKGKFIQGRDKKATFKIDGVKVELYYAIAKEWGATLLAYSSKKGSGIGLRIVARTKGFKLSQHGLFKKGKYVAGRTEKDIYKALGRAWKLPEKR